MTLVDVRSKRVSKHYVKNRHLHKSALVKCLHPWPLVTLYFSTFLGGREEVSAD